MTKNENIMINLAVHLAVRHNKKEFVRRYGDKILPLFQKSQRGMISRVSKVRRVFFYPVIAAFLLGCLVAWLSLMYSVIGTYLADLNLYRFQKLIPILLSGVALLMIFVIYWTTQIVNRYLGSYERITEELDEILSGQRIGPLETRKGDIVFKELLKRINALIKK